MLKYILPILLIGAPALAQQTDDLFTEQPAWTQPVGDLPVCKSGWHLHRDDLPYIPVEYTFGVTATARQPFVIKDAKGAPFMVLSPGQTVSLDCFDEDDL